MNEQRKAFEAHVRSECDSAEYADSILEKNQGGFYHVTRIQGAWEGWQAAIASQSPELEELKRRVSGLEAARIAYASEFPLNADGEPDVGNIHANMRKLKASQSPKEAMSDAEIASQWKESGKHGGDTTASMVIHFARAIIAATSPNKELVEALQASQIAIREMRSNGAPTAYWDDIEGGNIKALKQAGVEVV